MADVELLERPAPVEDEAPQPVPHTPHLVFADLGAPGITREKTADGWLYRTPDGKAVRDADEIARLNRVALPPAYTDAWYCTDPNGHIQAVGFDKRGRRQYRYHPDFRASQEASKFDRCLEFGLKLPKLRGRVERDLAGRGLTQDRVVAAVVRLLDIGHIRIGNREYAETNKSFGATTLKNRHAAVRGDKVRLQFRGKHGKEHDRSIRDPMLARVVKRCQDLPGQSLFTWKDGDGSACPVGSGDVNAYIQAVMGDGFSAKHFRTWWASVIALDEALKGVPPKQVVQTVADELGNTPAVARNSYIHPQVLALLAADDRPKLQRKRPAKHLASEERALLDLLARSEKLCAAA